MYFNKIKPNIHDIVYLSVTYIIYQVTIVPSSEQYFEEIYFSIQTCNE